MAYVYILQSKKNENYYIGSTDHFQQRMKQHEEGKVYTTKRSLPVELVLKQKCPDIQVAKMVERRIKKLKRRDYLEKMIPERI